MTDSRVPFNRATVATKQMDYVSESMRSGQIAGDGPFTKKASTLLSKLHENKPVLLTTSCTSALEMCALLLNISEGDEVICPSFTFVSSANAFALLGAKIVFVDIDPTTWNLDVNEVRIAIGPKTKAIVAVNYAGIASVTSDLLQIAHDAGVPIVEDNAHGLFAQADGRALGTSSAISTLSFHETKNVTCGEGGALVINNPSLVDRAEIIREKGTNRSQFFRGMIDKYTWIDKGSSFLISDINAAMLLAQLEDAKLIQERRRIAFNSYMSELGVWAEKQGIVLPSKLGSELSAFHMFPILMPNLESRTKLIEFAKKLKVGLAFHYVPLHSSSAGLRFGKTISNCSITNDISDRLVRLPLFSDINLNDVERVIETVSAFDDFG